MLCGWREVLSLGRNTFQNPGLILLAVADLRGIGAVFGNTRSWLVLGRGLCGTFAELAGFLIWAPK